MILTVTLNPCVDHTLFLDSIALGDTNRASKVERDAGGKGINVSRVIHNLGGHTVATGFLGGGAGAYVRATLDREGVGHEFAAIKDETRLNFSVETAAGTPPTCFNEPGPMILPEELESLLSIVRNQLSNARWVVLGGSRPGGLPDDILYQIGLMAREAGVPFALDADGQVLKQGIPAGPSFLKPNSSEASRLLGRTLSTVEDCIAGAREISGMTSAEDPIVVISRGADGAVMWARGETWVGKSPSVVCRSTVGSGDSMIAATLTHLSQGASPAEALRFGLAAGAATASNEGSGLATLEDVNELAIRASVEKFG